MLSINKPHYQIITSAGLSDTTIRQYCQAVDRMIGAGIDPRNRSALTDYAETLPNSSRAFLKSALRILFENQITELKSRARPENVQQIQALLYNIEAMNEAIRTTTTRGTKSHLWLTPEQVTELTTVDSLRDWLLLALLLHGLRRDEAVNLTFDRIKTVPNHNGGIVYVMDVTGKGSKNRTVPISKQLFDSLTEWRRRVGEGYILRSIDHAGNVNHSLSGQAISDIVAKHGARIELPQLQPHDLRRTYAHLLYANTRDIVLVSVMLGHGDTKTTMRYLNLTTDLDREITKVVPLAICP